MASSTATTLPNQADNLPATLVIDPVPILKGKDNFDDWTMYIKLALEWKGVVNLINSLTQQPGENDPRYTKWLQYSQDVHYWLLMHITAEIAQNIHKSSMPWLLVDEAYKAIT